MLRISELERCKHVLEFSISTDPLFRMISNKVFIIFHSISVSSDTIIGVLVQSVPDHLVFLQPLALPSAFAKWLAKNHHKI